MRINKFLSGAGYCSRREADRLIDAGRITINGRVAALGDTVAEGDRVAADGVTVSGSGQRPVVLMLNKPRGIVCSTVSTHGEQNVVDYVAYPERVYPVGRLDKNSEGLLLLTNQGELMDSVLKSRNFHEKEYLVTLNRVYTKDFLTKMEMGVPVLDTVTRPCRCYPVNEQTFGIVLTQGMNRQIRRMCEYFHYEVIKLERIRFMNLTLGALPRGAYRELTEQELDGLLRLAAREKDGTF